MVSVHLPDHLGVHVSHPLMGRCSVGVHLVHDARSVIVSILQNLLPPIPGRHFLLMDRHSRLVPKVLQVLNQGLPYPVQVRGFPDAFIDFLYDWKGAFVFSLVRHYDKFILGFPVMLVIGKHLPHKLAKKSAAGHRLLSFVQIVYPGFH